MNQDFNKNKPKTPSFEDPRKPVWPYVLIGTLVFLFIGGISAYAYYSLNLISSDLEKPNATSSQEKPKPNGKTKKEEIKPYVLEINWKDQLTKKDPNCERACDMIAGVVKNGDLANKKLYIDVEEGMGDYIKGHYVLLEKEKLYVNEYGSEDKKNWEIKDLTNLPQEIVFSEKGYKLIKDDYVNRFLSDTGEMEKLFDRKGINFYLIKEGSGKNCIIVRLPDQTVLAYDPELLFMNSENGELSLDLNGQKNTLTEEYNNGAFVGCGALCSPLNNINEISLEIKEEKTSKPLTELISPEEDFEVAGTAPNGEPFYKFKDPHHLVMEKLYNNENTIAHHQGAEGNKYTYEEYIDLHPLLYWQDPFGNWIQFKNKKFANMAEVCKPAIYLYPEKQITANVKVSPNGGFTKTIPDYSKQGWQVKVSPEGNIIETKNGFNYDYLYWSGIAVGYPINSQKGWIVEQNSLDSFLDQKLSQLGLSSREIKDFKDYWLKRMNEDPYYKISFLVNSQFNKFAPLEIIPRPDSIIRVIMTAKGLSQYSSIEPQILPLKPKREGFTAVEWGGVLVE